MTELEYAAIFDAIEDYFAEKTAAMPIKPAMKYGLPALGGIFAWETGKGVAQDYSMGRRYRKAMEAQQRQQQRQGR